MLHCLAMARSKRPAVEFPEPEVLPEWVSRPDVITIEGAAATGKGSISAVLHETYGYRYLSISAVARGLAVAFSEQYPLDSETALDEERQFLLRRFYAEAAIGIGGEGMDSRIHIDGTDVTGRLYERETGALAAHLMQYGAVKSRVAELSREVAASGNIILNGRLVAEQVAPEAELHILLEAGLEERTQRRYEQQRQADPSVVKGDVAAELVVRDAKEKAAGANRPFGGSLVVDTTGRTAHESALEIVKVYNTLSGSYPPAKTRRAAARPSWIALANRSEP